jgi:hypothetical protein
MKQNSVNNEPSLVEILFEIQQIKSRLSVVETKFNQQNPDTSVKLTGIPFGTEGFYDNNPINSYASVFDDDIYTFFDSSTTNNAICGINLETAKQITKIRFHPRINMEYRCIGGSFQSSLDGSDYEIVYQVNSLVSGWNEVTVNVFSQFIRYVAPIDSYGNIAEIEIYGF